MSTCDMEKRIRELAYQKWEAAGCPLTTEEERNRFWYEAEQEVLSIKTPEVPCMEPRTEVLKTRKKK